MQNPYTKTDESIDQTERLLELDLQLPIIKKMSAQTQKDAKEMIQRYPDKKFLIIFREIGGHNRRIR
jgi:hypothetical protein